MAIKATIFKATLQIADMDRHYYAEHALTLARHPSETDERMMVRLLAFALYAGDALAFGKGMNSDDEPDLWQKDLTGAIERWIEVGLPDERVIRKACGRAAQVVVVSYGRAADIWWNENRDKLQRLDNLTVIRLPLRDHAGAGRTGQPHDAAAMHDTGRTHHDDQRCRNDRNRTGSTAGQLSPGRMMEWR